MPPLEHAGTDPDESMDIEDIFKLVSFDVRAAETYTPDSVTLPLEAKKDLVRGLLEALGNNGLYLNLDHPITILILECKCANAHMTTYSCEIRVDTDCGLRKIQACIYVQHADTNQPRLLA